MNYQDEPQIGGLIDRYWLLNWIVIPSFLIASLFGIVYWIGHSCPFIEDVSSCFPYNLPTWAKVALPIALFIILIVALKDIKHNIISIPF